MNIGVAYADKFTQSWLKLEVPDNSTVLEAIEFSGMLTKYPEIDLSTQKVGIFGKVTKLDVHIEEGVRIEIYRKITADPEQVERKDRSN